MTTAYAAALAYVASLSNARALAAADPVASMQASLGNPRGLQHTLACDILRGWAHAPSDARIVVRTDTIGVSYEGAGWPVLACLDSCWAAIAQARDTMRSDLDASYAK